MKRGTASGRHYTVFYGDGEESANLMDDFKKAKNCDVIKVSYRYNKNPITRALRKIHTSHKINKYFRLPFRSFWYDFLHIKFKDPENETVIIYATPFFQYDVDVFMKKWNKRNIKTYFVFLDSMKIDAFISKEILTKIISYSAPKNIFSFDKEDCDKYGFNYLNEAYYPELDAPSTEIENDICFVAHIKPERIKTLNDLSELFEKHGVKYKFDIIASKEFDNWYYKNPTLNKNIEVKSDLIPYKKVLENVSKSNCVLEISQNGQNAPSLRYFEAVTRNRKLLTNVEYTKNLNYYNKKFMKITDFKEKNIDFDWIKKHEKTNYNYKKGAFSPINILKMIEELE